MSAISAADVGKLRAATGAGLMDCKKALAESSGDFEKAVDLIRKRGQQIAMKKADREIKAGAVFAHVDEAGKAGAALELGCETDFVARNDEFKSIGAALAREIASTKGLADEATLLASSFKGGSVKDTLTQLTGKIGENVKLGRFARFEAGANGGVFSYVHYTNTAGVLLELAASSPEVLKHEETKTLAKDLMLHITAVKPTALTREEIPADVVAREREVYMASDKLKGKPENMIGKIVDGMIETFYKSGVLLDQPFVKDEKKSVRDHVKATGKAAGGSVEVKRFALFSVGGK